MAFLIVEDDAAVADALRGLLSAAGFEVRAFSSGEAFLLAGPPSGADTVVIDLGLPGVSGATLIQWLGALADPPRVVVISGKSSRLIEREIAGLSPVQVLRKPPAADWFEAIAG
ncbi:response regulator [Chthonobacter rhizosphaerae]|uniref:response regulator n=1 Tax=Chthonobacter rhizosphaerae TaxID=2735553 RepID=UPI001AED9DD0|nr:response regulator [Chthonobacter rhizosphaerae]